MAIYANEDTEFNDALRKHGILPPLERPPPSPSPPPSPTLSDTLHDLTSSELRERVEEAKDDETERTAQAARQQRLREEREEQRRARFGRVYPIGRDDYTREVTEASKISDEEDEEERGTGVVVFLYKDGLPRSDIAKRHLDILAGRHPSTKFVSIVGDKCIPNLPDSRIPMFIIYRNGEVHNQLVSWGADRERKIEELEALLIVAGAVTLSKLWRPDSGRKKDSDEEEDEDEGDDAGRARATTTNGRTPKNIRRKTDGDDTDSDFEFDL